MAKRGPKRTLTVDHVAEAALRLLDTEGTTALSVRRVAATLDVAPNAIYTYVDSRAALERLVAENLLASADVQLLSGPPAAWRARIQRYAGALRERLLEHPGAASLLMTAPMDGPAALDVGEALLAALADAGLGPEERTRATWLVIVHVVGSVALEVAETDGRAGVPPEAERVAQRREALAGVDASRWPLTAERVDVQAAWITGDQLAWGLDRILDGLVVGRTETESAVSERGR